MTKKIFSMMAAGVMLFATSCQDDLGINGGDASMVEFVVSTPEIATRAYSDGQTATELQYAVYNSDHVLLGDLTKTNGRINGSTTVNLKLTTGNTYYVLFWAAAEGAPYKLNFAEKTMEVDYTNATCNDEKRDAFYAYQKIEVKGAQTETIELRRPFAQLNIGTADYAASTSAGYTPTYSAVTVKSLCNTLNFQTGAVNGTPADITFGMKEIKKDETFPVAGNEYLAMNYLLINSYKETVDIEFAYGVSNDINVAKTRTVGSVPVQRNYRTNIYGSLLTSEVDINVEIKPEYDGTLTADALYHAAAFGGEVTLTEDVVLTTPLIIQANATIDLGGKTLTGAISVAEGVQATISNGKVVNTNNAVSGITSKGDLTLNDVNVESARHALRIESGNAIINGGIYKVVPVSNSTLFALNVGDGPSSIANVVVKGGTFIGPKGTMADSGGAVTVKTASTVKIEGGDFSGGKNNTLSSNGTLEISGGVFDQEPKAEWIAAGCKALQSGDKYFVVSNTAGNVVVDGDALKQGLEAGGNVILLNDITISERIDIQPGFESHLDLNGKTITSDADYVFIVREGAKLTMDGEGRVELNPNQVLFYPAGDLVINGGTYVRNIPDGYTGALSSMFVGTKPAGGWDSTGVTINGGYFDGGYYDTNAADIEEILAGTKMLVETADDIAKRGQAGDKNVVRVALKNNVMKLLNRSHNYFRIYGGTFVGANPAWGDEGGMLPTTPYYLRPWSYYQGAFLDGQKFNENGIVLPEGYTITKSTHADGRPIYTVTYSK
jgi:hypothetical protein